MTIEGEATGWGASAMVVHPLSWQVTAMAIWPDFDARPELLIFGVEAYAFRLAHRHRVRRAAVSPAYAAKRNANDTSVIGAALWLFGWCLNLQENNQYQAGAAMRRQKYVAMQQQPLQIVLCQVCLCLPTP